MADTPLSTIKRRPPAWVFGLVFMALSMVIEIALIVVFRLRIPQDNAIIAPILLTVSPVAASLLCRYRRAREILLLSCLAVFFTLLLVLVFSRVTGITTGILPPIFLRTAGGLLAAAIVNRRLSSRNHFDATTA
jgi:hypothetical protein